MLRCREVVALVASDAWRDLPVMRRVGVRLHLGMCRHCRAYARQLKKIGEAARRLYGAVRPDTAAAERVVRVIRLAAERGQRPGSSELS